MIEKQMLRLMLGKAFYTKYKGTISPTIFTGDISSLFDTIQKAHAKYSDDISVDELYSLHTAIFNPALTRAAKEKFSELVEDIKEIQEPSKEIAKDIMRILSDRDLAQRIAVEATEIFNGKDANFTEITGMIENHKQGDEEKTPAVTNNVKEVLGLLDVTTKWKFNIPVLKQNVGGIGGGNLMIAFARPETGKTAFWVSLCAGPEGFAEQGAKVHAFINEEPAIRTQMRAISCYTGMTREEIILETPNNAEEISLTKTNGDGFSLNLSSGESFLINDTTIGTPQSDYVKLVNSNPFYFTTDEIFARQDDQFVNHWMRVDNFPDSANYGKLMKDTVADDYFDITKSSPFGLYQTRSHSYVIGDKGLEVGDKIYSDRLLDFNKGKFIDLFEIEKNWKHPVNKANIVKLISFLKDKDLRAIKQI